MSERPTLGQILTHYALPRHVVDSLIANKHVSPEDRSAVLEVLYAHDRAHMVQVVVCHCGAKVFDIVSHQEDCLRKSGLLLSDD